MRKCGICERGLRDGDHPEAIRVGAEGLNPVVVEKLKCVGGKTAIAAGLYSACGECVHVLRPFVAERLTAQAREEERVNALVERRPEKPIADIAADSVAANDLC